MDTQRTGYLCWSGFFKTVPSCRFRWIEKCLLTQILHVGPHYPKKTTAHEMISTDSRTVIEYYSSSWTSLLIPLGHESRFLSVRILRICQRQTEEEINGEAQDICGQLTLRVICKEYFRLLV